LSAGIAAGGPSRASRRSGAWPTEVRARLRFRVRAVFAGSGARPVDGRRAAVLAASSGVVSFVHLIPEMVGGGYQGFLRAAGGARRERRDIHRSHRGPTSGDGALCHYDRSSSSRRIRRLAERRGQGGEFGLSAHFSIPKAARGQDFPVRSSSVGMSSTKKSSKTPTACGQERLILQTGKEGVRRWREGNGGLASPRQAVSKEEGRARSTCLSLPTTSCRV